MQKIPPLDLAKDVIKNVLFLDCPTRKDVMKEIRKRLKNTDYAFPASIQLWLAYRELVKDGLKKNPALEKALRVKDVRTDSGVAPITVLTKPFPCPGRCVYCPTETRMPKSYLSSEPAAARALSLKFDPYEQVLQRVKVLERNGHQTNKIELIIKGGTWSAYTASYREWFIKRCFEAANNINHPACTTETEENLQQGDLLNQQTINETAEHRIIGLTIETRPDWIKPKEVIHLRRLGVTRVELGLQIINDRVLKLTKRGTTVADAERAISLLKSTGFKVDVHILPGQPGASTQDDLDSFKKLFDDPRFRPDMVKIYPCVVLPNAELAEWTARGEYRPLEGSELKELLIKMQAMVPRYCRVPRLIRDFPTTEITHGNKQSNLRESIESEMKKRGLACVCLRCREVGHVPGDHTMDETKIFEERYENADGLEVFLSVENMDRSAVFAFLRLRLPKIPLNLPLTRETCMLHGTIIPYDKKLTVAARELRNNQTPAEKSIWQFLKRDATQYRFLRQKPIDHFIVDFYCSQLLLAIEIDGSYHEEKIDYDQQRSDKLATYGIKVIRYTNQQVLTDFDNTKKDLMNRLAERHQDLLLSSKEHISPLTKGDQGGIYETFPVLKNAAIIRELHTYGTALNIDQHRAEAAQHKGYGRLLMEHAEKIALLQGYAKIAVISGVGVREYYKNVLGYHEQDTYMVKDLKQSA